MEIDAAREFVREHRNAVLLTNRGSGAPQMSPVTCAVDTEGLIAISTRQTAIKVKNIRRDPRVSLCVLSDGFYGRWIQVDGTAEIVPLPEAMDPLVEYYRSLRGEHDDWADYRAAMERDQRLVLRITIERAGPDVSG